MDAILQTLARELERSPEHVQNVVTLIDEGATIPFIARYRKELHGSMDDQLLRRLADRLQYLRNLEARKGEVAAAIENQGKLTQELSDAIAAAATLAEVQLTFSVMNTKLIGTVSAGNTDCKPLNTKELQNEVKRLLLANISVL